MTKSDAIHALRLGLIELDRIPQLEEQLNQANCDWTQAIRRGDEIHAENIQLKAKLENLDSTIGLLRGQLLSSRQLVDELQEQIAQLNPKDKNGRWVINFYRGEEKVFAETVFSAPTHEYLNARQKQYNANCWMITYQSPGTTILPHGLC